MAISIIGWFLKCGSSAAIAVRPFARFPIFDSIGWTIDLSVKWFGSMKKAAVRPNPKSISDRNRRYLPFSSVD